MHLHQVGLDEKAGFAASAAAHHKHVFVPCVLRLLRAAVHHQPFRLCEQHIVFKHRVDVRAYIVGAAPSRATKLFSPAIFLRVFSFGIDNKPDNHRADNANEQIQRVNTRQGIFKGCGKALCNMQHLCGKIRAGGKPRRLSHFIKEIHKEQIRQIGKYQLFQIYAFHRSMPPLV